MKGNTLSEFMDDLLTCGGPEKEFTFRGRQYFMEARYHADTGMTELYLNEYGCEPEKEFVFQGTDLRECVHKFEQAKVFDDLTIYEAEQEIEVLFG